MAFEELLYGKIKPDINKEDIEVIKILTDFSQDFYYHGALSRIGFMYDGDQEIFYRGKTIKGANMSKDKNIALVLDRIEPAFKQDIMIFEQPGYNYKGKIVLDTLIYLAEQKAKE